MDQGEIVKTCNIIMKEKGDKKKRDCKQITFNCSDALLYAPSSIFFSQMISIMKKIKQDTYPQELKDPL